MEVDCSNSVNHNQIQILSYGYLPVVRIEPATFRWFLLEALNQMPISFASFVQQDTWCNGHKHMGEGWRTHQSKHSDYNNKNRDNSLKTLNGKTYQALSQKFR